MLEIPRLPTGAGKTVISALLIDQLLDLLEPRRILFLAHRKEIIDQTAVKIGQQIGLDRVGVEQADRRADLSVRVVVGSVQTIIGRLDDFDPEDFAAIIVDECHHAFAKTWMDTISHFGKRADTLLLGLTATPKRSDGRSIEELFPETAFEISLGELQDQGYLVPMDYCTIEASLGLGELSVQSGDFQATLLGKIMNSDEMRALTVKACLEKARGKKTIAFCASIKHAEDLTRDFNSIGIKAAYISGETEDRDQIIEDFREGKIQVLSNFAVLTEGFDDPSIECVLLARPTTSPLVYSQCLGRGLRPIAGKEQCIVIDIVDRQRNPLQYNAYEAAGLPRSWKGSGKDPLREAEAIARIRVTDPNAFLSLKRALSIDESQKILMGLDPRTVLAGIDGMPLIRYNPEASPRLLSTADRLELAEGLLKDAGIKVLSMELEGEEAKAQFAEDYKLKASPYLAWQLEKASGLRFQCTVIKVEEPEPVLKALPIPIPPPIEAVKKNLPRTETKITKPQEKAKAAASAAPTPPPAAALPKPKTLDLMSRFKAVVQIEAAIILSAVERKSPSCGITLR
ncbi:MAG: DEAD/DEAH box helicase [Proteobacteria bacterium]|nr:MAG: DEAD/DEAH box helicase [Pseudomonadota bacterium]